MAAKSTPVDDAKIRDLAERVRKMLDENKAKEESKGTQAPVDTAKPVAENP